MGNIYFLIPFHSARRRGLIKQLIQSFNVVLVALLMYNLWRHKWTKVNFN